MPFPRPAKPAALWNDLRQLVASRSRYQILFMVLAIAMPVIIVIGFIKDANTNTMPGPQLIYVQSWPATRSDDEIKAQQKIDQAKHHAALKERQRQYQELEKRLGM